MSDATIFLQLTVLELQHVVSGLAREYFHGSYDNRIEIAALSKKIIQCGIAQGFWTEENRAELEEKGYEVP